MNRRKAKKAFKKKWRSGGRIALLKTVPKGFSVREADKVNEDFQAAFLEGFARALDEVILYGTKVFHKKPEILYGTKVVYKKPEILPPLLPEVIPEKMHKDIT